MKTILIIDDHEHADSTAELLQSEDRNVLWAKNEKEVMNYFDNNKVDIVVIDPLMNIVQLSENKELVKNAEFGGVGYVLLFNLREKMKPGKKDGVKLIFHTRVSQKNLIRIGFSENTPYFRKPIVHEKIINEINL
jgi:CheY-like chemotaxis protein